MMDKKKDITITTSAFSLTIHWNGPVIATQLSILVGAILLWVVTNSESVHKLCLVIGLLDLAAMIISMLIGSKIEVTDASGGSSSGAPSPKSTPAPSPKSKEAPAEKEEKVKSHKSTSTTDGTIKNKVPLPAQRGVSPAPVHEPVPASSEPLPPQEMPEPKVEEPKPKKVEEMDENDLDDLFNW